MPIFRRPVVGDALLNEIGLELVRFAGKQGNEAILAELKGSMEGLGVECSLKGFRRQPFWLLAPSKAAYQWTRVTTHMRVHGLRKTISKIIRVLAMRLGIAC